MDTFMMIVKNFQITQSIVLFLNELFTEIFLENNSEIGSFEFIYIYIFSQRKLSEFFRDFFYNLISSFPSENIIQI